MRIRYYKPFSPDQLGSLGLPSDPTDSQINAVPTGTLHGLIDRVYEQLDCDNPPLEAVDWYNALSEALRERADDPRILDRPA